MKARFGSRWLMVILGLSARAEIRAADNTAPPVFQAPPAPAAPAAPASATAVPPPSAPVRRSQADLEKLVAPIALYPDPLLSIVLPAAVYPLEIVQAARFVKDTNNLPQLDAQPWDVNVKAVAKFPSVVQKMNDDLSWTVDLGQAFLDQQKDLMDAVQAMRLKAQAAGTLQTTPQQTVYVTNVVVQQTAGAQTIIVTNQVVQILPAQPQVVYVPQYNPTVVYAPPPSYVYNPVAPLVTFGVGMAVGAIIANNCDWHSGGIYVGGGGFYGWGGGGNNDVDININNNNTINNINNVNQRPRPAPTSGGGGQPWKPDSGRLQTSGAPGSAATLQTREARGWGSGAAAGSAPGAAATRPATTPAAGGGGNRPTTGAITPGNAAAATPGFNRPATQPSTARPSATPAATPSARPAAGGNLPASSAKAMPASRPSGGNAFSGVNNSGAQARNSANRGAASRAPVSRGGGGGGGRRGR